MDRMRRNPDARGTPGIGVSVESALARPRSPVSAHIRVRSHEIIQDKPPALGGEDQGVMASELLLAGLLACQLSTFYKVAKKRRMEATANSIQGDLHFDQAGEIERVELTWKLDAAGAKVEQIETLLRLTDKACTISKVLRVAITSKLA
jgi:uncharacterized OsmC-like protein